MDKINLEEIRPAMGFSELDWAFAEMLARRSACEASDALQLLAAAVLNVTEDSHSCLNLSDWLEKVCQKKASALAEAKQKLQDAEALPEENARAMAMEIAQNAEMSAAALPELPELAQWQEAIEHCWSAAVAIEGVRDTGLEPLVWLPDRNALYLRKFRSAELAIRAFVGRVSNTAPKIGANEVWAVSSRFQTEGKNLEDATEQVAAAAGVFQQDFAIVTGGPGTGKTTTLAAVLALELRANPNLRVALCAPTGKAAAQMRQSIAGELKNLTVPDDVKSQLGGLQAGTIHKLLGISLAREGLPKYGPSCRLPYGLVVVDECSMVPLLLFRQLLEALPEGGRMLLLGDKDQLDSVEAGRVFAELCTHATTKNIALFRLRKNFRSKDNPRLVAFAQTLADGNPNQTEAETLSNELFAKGEKECQGAVFGAVEISEDKVLRAKLADLCHSWVPELSQKPQDEREAFQRLEQFRVLCAVREGAFGVKRLNELLVEIILGKGKNWRNYPDGLPIMVTRNDSVTRLNNGDVGVCWDKMVWFAKPVMASGKVAEQPDDQAPAMELRCFQPSQLPPHEPAFAMTVHKAQGGSYQHVVVVLPPEGNSELLTLNLIYTAITRARKNCLVLARQAVLVNALQTVTVRWGNLLK